MKRAIWVIFPLLVMVCSCTPAIKCDDEGMIIIPKDVSLDTRIGWNERNMKLAGQRLDRVTGMSTNKWVTPTTLEKAKGCP